MALLNTHNYDQISNLPDDILSHLLSFLPTKYSVRTRVLSKRWKQLFTLVPVLDFFIDEVSETESFIDFVNWVFNSYNVDQMDRFRFKSSINIDEGSIDPSLFNFWISESLRRGVRVLDVDAYTQVFQILPRSIFTCETLTYLKLKVNFDLDIPEEVRLPCVKTLHLFGVCFRDLCSANKILGSCPILEHLSICWHVKNIQHLNISIPTLASLKMHIRGSIELVLDVPSLKYLEFSRYVPCEFSMVQGFKSLSEAHISFDLYSEQDLNKNFEVAQQIISVICHARDLCLSAYTIGPMKTSGQTLPVFHNLTHLEILDHSSSFSGSILDFLNETPHLEVLLVDQPFSENDEVDQPLLPENVPACVSLHLKQVEFKRHFSVNQCKLVEYFFKNAKVLDTLKILSRDHLGMHFDKLREKFPTIPMFLTSNFKSGMVSFHAKLSI